MKKLSFLTIAFFSCCLAVTAQMNPLKGSGKLVNKTFNLTNFNKIQLSDLDGNVTITAGKSYAIAITIDDNLEPLLAVAENNGTLTLAFEGNRNNKRYVEKTNINITITLPSLLLLENNGNANVTIGGISGSSFTLKNLANGNATISGTATNIDVVKAGNGNVDAQLLIAQKAVVNANGNGNVQVNASNYFIATGSGNGDVVNKGAALPASGSAMAGNGEVSTQKNHTAKNEN